MSTIDIFIENIDSAKFTNDTGEYVGRWIDNYVFIANFIDNREIDQYINILFQYDIEDGCGEFEITHNHPTIGTQQLENIYTDESRKLFDAIFSKFGQEMFDPKNYEEFGLPNGCLEEYVEELSEYGSCLTKSVT